MASVHPPCILPVRPVSVLAQFQCPQEDGPMSTVLTRLAEADTDEALAVFDQLPAVDVDEVLGNWRGEELATGSAFDGLLVAYGWHGKRFRGGEDVDPLVFDTRVGRICLNPWLMPVTVAMAFPRPVRRAGHVHLGRWLLPLARTRRPRARLRMVEHRGRTSTAMVYDDLPIIDHLRRIDDDTLLGLMDMRGLDKPCFFLLHRE